MPGSGVIRDLICHRLTAPLHTPFVTARRSTSAVETVVVEMIATDGLRGFGEAPAVWQVTGESLAGAEACIGGPLRDVIVGRDPDDLQDLLSETSGSVFANYGAKAAVDVALHDLAARRLGISLPRLLGTSRHHIPTDVTISAGEPGQIATDAGARVGDGFSVLKVKVGIDPTHDVERVRAVRDFVGPDVALRVDANQGWTPRQAVAIIRALEDRGVELEFIEQPVAAEDLDGLAAVTRAVDTAVMADEACFGIRDLYAVIDRRAADLVNIKLAKCGGLRAARTMLELAAAHQMGVVVGSMMESPIGVGAAASLVAAYGTTMTSDLDAAWWTSTSPVVGGLTYDGGMISLPDAPGLGIEGLA